MAFKPKRKTKNIDTMQGPIPEDTGHKHPGYGPHEFFDYAHNPAWRMFRIMAEFVDGFHFITKFPKSVTFFGSARFEKENPHYRSAQKLAHLLAKDGYTIITGGGPGIMEAANKGAIEGGGKSVGLNIQLPTEQRVNPYVRKGIAFNYFFTRKVMLAFSANAYVFFPGGYGTLDEAFELMTLRQTHKINPKIPIILVGKDFWEPLANWLSQNACQKHCTINPDELKLWDLVDTPEETFELIKKRRPKNR